MKKLYIAIGIGGIIGAICRYAISLLFLEKLEVTKFFGDCHSCTYVVRKFLYFLNYQGLTNFPYATLTVNLVGCFFLSFLMSHPFVKAKIPQEVFSALTVGAIGSFTTYSTFAVETIELWHSSIVFALSYLFVSTIGGLACCYVGYRVATRKRVSL